jgi:Mg/Co/Ni transporter MgtE
VRNAMTPLDSLKSVGPNEDLNGVPQIIAQDDINQVPVIYQGKIIGMVRRDNIINFVNTRAGL